MNYLRCGACIFVLAVSACGCAKRHAAPLEAQQFYSPGNTLRQNDPSGPARARVSSNEQNASSATAAKVVPAYVSEGRYMIVGTVVAEANGKPIYADKVLNKINEALAAQARKLEQREFRIVAGQLINRQIMEEITNELEFAAAERNLNDEDQRLATALTMQFRQREINKAGGSLAVARARSLEEGLDFDEKLAEEYRRNMIKIYYYKKIFPRVQVSADEMREFYNRHLDEYYTEKQKILFRVIRVDVKENGGREAALQFARDIHAKAKRGDNFGDLAAKYESDRAAQKRRGYLDVLIDPVTREPMKDAKGEPIGVWFDKGSMKQEELEKAIFALEPGQITEIIDGGDAFYIGKLEDKKPGKVFAFEDEKVQSDIRDRLEKEQRDKLRKREQSRLQAGEAWQKNEKLIELAIEMAMQKYAIWARAQ